MKRLLPFLFVMLWMACEREVNLTPPLYQSKLVVNGLLSNEDEIRVMVSTSVTALSNQSPQILEDAQVEIWEDGNSLGLGQFDVFDKNFAWPVVPQSGKSYRIRVVHPNYPPVDETLIMPSSKAISSVVYEDSVGIDTSGGTLAAITVIINDPGDEENHYRLRFEYYSLVVPGFIPFSFLSNDAVLRNPATIKEDDGSYVFNDQLFNGSTRNIRITFSRDIAFDVPRFRVVSEVLSEDLYRYQSSIARYEETKDNPLTEPVFVHSNIRGGLGIWAGKIAERDTIY
ncbi:MAG: DUF4249 domain-containing protein [Bacteroidota bacterium]|nr:DUF4249 domain-containing protein [Bacteroidota bacterium]MDX5430349.1 DUF4249 domain-containing protein [Bacteroidota bacterium]MDX5469110.1 DUF4249 domain-containing protein [Bacteroidota bacterium]